MTTAEVRSNRVETVATILLALAAVATAWTSYQSAQWRGEQAAHTAKSTAARISSASAAGRAGQQQQVDIATFSQWIDATANDEAELADFYRDRFRAEFVPAFDAWLATDPLTNDDAPKTPFEMPEYVLAESEKAASFEAEATRQSAAATDSLERADNYMLAVVIFAASLFFAGMSTKLRSVRHREVLIAFGSVLFIGTAIWLATQPVKLVS